MVGDIKKITSILVIAKEWRDKVNGNSYFATQITLNLGGNYHDEMEQEVNFKIEMQYGYGDQYVDNALRFINEIGNFKFENRYLNNLRWLLGGPERVSDSSQIRSYFLKIENCKKKEVVHWGGDPEKNRQRMEDVREWLTGKVDGVTTE
tara:strand:+ start:7533 stop:7979 length:447 start_codon:yes stop_codon:yes gene_type:complete